MAVRKVPHLEFRLDKVSDNDAELERIFSRIEEERDREKSG
jgi:ribosome-binding factor A